jgi:hypothetical protein
MIGRFRPEVLGGESRPRGLYKAHFMTECARFHERFYNDSGLSRDSWKKWSKQAFRRYRLT